MAETLQTTPSSQNSAALRHPPMCERVIAARKQTLFRTNVCVRNQVWNIMFLRIQMHHHSVPLVRGYHDKHAWLEIRRDRT